MRKKLQRIYEDKYKVLLFIPLIILALAFVQIGIQYSVTGDFVNKGITLKGGSTITIEQDLDVNEIELFLTQKFVGYEFSVRELSAAGSTVGIAIDSDAQDEAQIEKFLTVLREKLAFSENQVSVEIVGSSLGESFFHQTAIALLFAFFLMGLVVFAYFRKFVPSITVIVSAFSDIVITLAIFNLTGIKLSSAGIAAFLMIIGYSVDTDILLNTRMLKRTLGSEMHRMYGAIKTGLTMTGTTLVALFVSIIFVQSEVIKQIMIILFIGLLVDIMVTYLFNSGILRLYLERKVRR